MNKIKDTLINLNLSTSDSFHFFHKGTRDRHDINVLKCKKSDVYILDTTDHITEEKYSSKNCFTYWSSDNLKQAKMFGYEDDVRRSKQFGEMIKNKNWLDFGTGAGGILDILSTLAKNTYAIELQEHAKKALLDQGYSVYDTIDNYSGPDIDIVTLFHVFEHLTEPIDILKKIYSRMGLSSKIIIEIPHAKDILIELFNLEAFIAFTFWSEHLILHTKESLNKFLQEAGFKNIIILGHQRYPISNHMYWLSKAKPGGHNHYSFLNSDMLHSEYNNVLNKIGMTDTLIAIAEK